MHKGPQRAFLGFDLGQTGLRVIDDARLQILPPPFNSSRPLPVRGSPLEQLPDQTNYYLFTADGGCPVHLWVRMDVQMRPGEVGHWITRQDLISHAKARQVSLKGPAHS